jgi:uncharacterized membrane protein
MNLDENIDSSKNTIDEQGNIRIDYLFSYWVFAWFILFYFVDKKTNYGRFIINYLSPMVALWFVLIYDFIFFVKLIGISSNSQTNTIINFSIMLLMIKVVPIYILRRTHIQWFRDTIAFIGIFTPLNILNGTF